MSERLAWMGQVLAVQPRIRLLRSFDESQHRYLGFVLRIQGDIDGYECDFRIAIGNAAHAKHEFRSADEVEGKGVGVADPRMETADQYKVSGLKVLPRASGSDGTPPPFLGVPPALEIYRERGHRRLSATTYKKKCQQCIWGCHMPVEMIIDHWNPSKKRFRRETFCYGPKSCPTYKAGPTRKVPGRNGMSWEEEDWIDEEAMAHRGPDE